MELTSRKHSQLLHETLRQKGRVYKLAKGQIIQSTEDRQVINLLTRGYVKRYLINKDGTKATQVLYGPGDVFPITLVYKVLLSQAIYDGPEVYYYEAMTPVELYTIESSTLLGHVKGHPVLYRGLMHEAGNRLNSTLLGLENVTMRNSYLRVAHQLLHLADRFGISSKGQTKIALPVTHQDLADMLSLTRETVTTSMKQLRAKKLVITNELIVIPDIDKLKDEVYG